MQENIQDPQKIRNIAVIAHVEFMRHPQAGFYSFTQGVTTLSKDWLRSGSAYIRRLSLGISSRQARSKSERGLLFPGRKGGL